MMEPETPRVGQRRDFARAQQFSRLKESPPREDDDLGLDDYDHRSSLPVR